MRVSATACLVVLGVMMATPRISAQNTDVATYRSDHAGKRYDFTVTNAQIMATPDWPETADYPPLSPRKALASARGDLATFLPDATQWTQPTITLAQVGAPHKWMYIVQFHGPLPAGVEDGPVDLMRVLVLMNGTAIQPVISPLSAQDGQIRRSFPSRHRGSAATTRPEQKKRGQLLAHL